MRSWLEVFTITIFVNILDTGVRTSELGYVQLSYRRDWKNVLRLNHPLIFTFSVMYEMWFLFILIFLLFSQYSHRQHPLRGCLRAKQGHFSLRTRQRVRFSQLANSEIKVTTMRGRRFSGVLFWWIFSIVYTPILTASNCFVNITYYSA